MALSPDSTAGDPHFYIYCVTWLHNCEMHSQSLSGKGLCFVLTAVGLLWRRTVHTAWSVSHLLHVRHARSPVGVLLCTTTPPHPPVNLLLHHFNQSVTEYPPKKQYCQLKLQIRLILQCVWGQYFKTKRATVKLFCASSFVSIHKTITKNLTKLMANTSLKYLKMGTIWTICDMHSIEALQVYKKRQTSVVWSGEQIY